MLGAIFRSLLLWGTIHSFTFYFSFEKRIEKNRKLRVSRVCRGPRFSKYFFPKVCEDSIKGANERRDMWLWQMVTWSFLKNVEKLWQNNDISIINLYPDTFFHVSHSYKQFNIYFKKSNLRDLFQLTLVTFAELPLLRLVSWFKHLSEFPLSVQVVFFSPPHIFSNSQQCGV